MLRKYAKGGVMSKSYVNGWCRPRKRLAIYIRDNFTCLWCGADLRFVEASGISLDHLEPKVNGGTNNAENLITACHACNSRRQDTPWREFCDGMFREVWIESQVRLPLNFELVDALLNQRSKEQEREYEYLKRKAAEACGSVHQEVGA
jgi:hypothetical protein